MQSHDRDISIRDLDRDELRHVTTTFARRIGFAVSYENPSKWKVMSTDDFIELLSFDNWPSSDATTEDLFWCSQPLRHKDFRRLDEYSVYWQKVSKEVRLWIAREPVMPTNSKRIYNASDLFTSLLSSCNIYISDEYSHDHGRAMRKFRIDLLKWHLKSMIPTVLFVLVGLTIVGAYNWSEWSGSTVDKIGSLLLYAGGFIVGAVVSRLAVSRLGFMSGTMLLAVLYSLIFYLYVVTLEKINVLDQPLSSGDNVALVICALLGVFVADLKYPGVTIRSLLTRDILRVIYRHMIVPASLVVAPAFGVLKVTEYVIARVVEDFRSAAILVPIAGMIIVALLELIRRELEHEDSL